MVAILVTATTAMNEFKKSSHTNTLVTIYYRSFDNWRLFHQPTPTPTSPQQKSNKKISLWHIGNWELLPTATTWYHMKESAKENEKATTADPYLFGEEEDGWERKGKLWTRLGAVKTRRMRRFNEVGGDVIRVFVGSEKDIGSTCTKFCAHL